MPKHTITFEAFVPVHSTLVVDADTPFEAARAVLDSATLGDGLPRSLGFSSFNTIVWEESRDPAIIGIIGPFDDETLGEEILGNGDFLRMHTSSTFDPTEDRFFYHDEFRLEFDAVMSGKQDPTTDSIIQEADATGNGILSNLLEISDLEDTMHQQIRDIIIASGVPVQITAFKHAEDAMKAMVSIFGPLGQNAADCGFATISATAKRLLDIDGNATIRLLRVIARALEMEATPPSTDAMENAARNALVAEEMNEVDTIFRLAIQRKAAGDSPTIN